MASIVGSQYGFFAPQGTTLNVVFSTDGTNLPAAISGAFNLEVITSPTGASVTLPSGYQGVATFPGGTGQSVNLALGNINVADTGTNDTIIAGPGNSSIGGGNGGGATVTIGGAAGDTMIGGTGTDFLDGTKGSQSIVIGSAGNETIYSGAGDTVNGGGAASAWDETPFAP